MFIIMDERESEWVHKLETDSYGKTGMTTQMMQLAEWVVVVKDDTYLVLKDRMSGNMDHEFPLEELPDEIKSRLVNKLKFRDGISTDD